MLVVNSISFPKIKNLQTQPKFGFDSTAAIAAGASASTKSDDFPPAIGLGLMGAGLALHFLTKGNKQVPQLPQSNSYQTKNVQSYMEYNKIPLRFGSSSGNDHFDMASVDDALVGLGAGLAKNYLKAPQAKYDKITNKYKTPNATFVGRTLLAKARMATNQNEKADYLSQAELRFNDAAIQALSNTSKAEALRLAAVAAKLNGRSTAIINSYMNDAKQARIQGRAEHTKCEAEGMDLSTKITSLAKEVVTLPLGIIESFLDDVLNLFGKDPNDPMQGHQDLLNAISPYAKHVRDTAKKVKIQSQDLHTGESSDEDWFNDKPRTKASTRKGLRHPYI